MNTKIQKSLLLVTVFAGVFAAGCELIVDFDRTKIPVEVSEASAPADASPPDEASVSDSGDAAAPELDATPELDAAADADAGD